ncbi:hypothetical protein CSUI_002346 [Cystoisospora suis]|uniref:Transmembrane protein n=1 Tax=Cystoisospora suis TaxID=483139 RepID=A0A2C6L9Q0_9APIC|nr:hypothetical protein CSUI_002346 [Cystoisospora suis]
MRSFPRFCAVFAATLAVCLPAVVAITLEDTAARFGLKLKPAAQAAASAARGQGAAAPLPFQQRAAAIAAKHQGGDPVVQRSAEPKKSMAQAAFGSALKPVGRRGEMPRILPETDDDKFHSAFKAEWLQAVKKRQENPQLYNSEQEMAYQATKAAIAQLDLDEIKKIMENSKKQAESIKRAQEKLAPQRAAMQQEYMQKVGGVRNEPRVAPSPRPQATGIQKGSVAKAKGKFQ